MPRIRSKTWPPARHHLWLTWLSSWPDRKFRIWIAHYFAWLCSPTVCYLVCFSPGLQRKKKTDFMSLWINARQGARASGKFAFLITQLQLGQSIPLEHLASWCCLCPTVIAGEHAHFTPTPLSTVAAHALWSKAMHTFSWEKKVIAN